MGNNSRFVRREHRRAHVLAVALGILVQLGLLALVLALGTLAATAGAAPDPIPASVEFFGLPERGPVLRHPGFTVLPDGRSRSGFVLERLSRASLAHPGERPNSFFADSRVPAECRAQLADYEASGFDRGHLAAAQNHPGQDATFSLANMSPQVPALNRGLWKQIETQLRRDTQAQGTAALWVCTLPLWMPDAAPAQGEACAAGCVVTYRVIGPNHLPVPTHFGKSALAMASDGTLTLRAWRVPNTEPPPGAKPDDYLCTTDYLEHWSGLDLWSALPNAIEDRLEAGKD